MKLGPRHRYSYEELRQNATPGAIYSRDGVCGQGGLYVHDGHRFDVLAFDNDSMKADHIEKFILWEHSDLLKLKAAVERALEVTPKPTARYKISGCGNPSTISVFISYDNFSTPGDLVADFETANAAREYVAWKNGEGK